LKTKSPKDEQKYKTYHRYYLRVLNEAEANYYQSQFDFKSNLIKQIWYNLNSVTSLSKKNKVSIPKLTVDGSNITNPKLICNTLNSYYCSITKK